MLSEDSGAKMEELQYYATCDDYCCACLNTSSVVPLLPNNAKVFFSNIEASVLTPWLCNRCSDILLVHRNSSWRSSQPEFLESYEELKSRARRAQTLLSDILLNSQIVKAKVDYYIAELNEIKGIKTKEKSVVARYSSFDGRKKKIYELRTLKKPKPKAKISLSATKVVFDEDDNMYARLAYFMIKKVKVIQITEGEYLKWIKEQLQTEAYRNSKYKCENCALGFSHISTFREHMTSHCSSVGAHHCPLCQQYFESVDSLDAHKKRHLSHHSCVDCGLHTNDRTVVADHYFSAHTQITFHCRHCDVVAREPTALKQHLNIAHQYECHDCGKVFLNKYDVQEHIMQKHLEMPSLQCSKCEEMFVLQRHRRLHYRRVHCKVRPIKNKICDVCGKAFEVKRDLNRHVLVHTGEKPYQCEQCGLRFRQRSIMKIHFKIKHMGVPYKEILLSRGRRFLKT